jgi:hypothetical protein
VAALQLAGPIRLAQSVQRAESRGQKPTRIAASPGETVEDWLINNGQTPRIREMLWEPLALAALNQSVRVAAAPPFVAVLAQMFGGRPQDASLALPTWPLDQVYAEPARRFIEAFRVIFGDELPPPEPAQAARYWHACTDNEIAGRCVRLGYNDALSPVLHYHWAICRREDDAFVVQEFWHPELWTTERYRALVGYGGRCPGRRT